MARRHVAKKRRERSLRKRVLIVVEGATGKSEQVYFQQLVQVLRSEQITVDVKVLPGAGEPKRVLEKCRDELNDPAKKDYDHACLVIDDDNHPTLDRVLRDCVQSSPKVDAVITNPQFELWLLWHHQDHTSFIDSKALTKKVIELKLVTGRDGKELAQGFPVKNYPKAIQRAHQVRPNLGTRERGGNPSSGIPWLIAALQTGMFS
jgi:hypothetical protein